MSGLSARWSLIAALLLAPLVAAGPAAALPSFADQTGQPCTACHVGGFGPQLTPFGRQFKLEGYTARSNDKAIPFSAMVNSSFTHTSKDQATAPAPRFSPNDNPAMDESSLFLASGFGQHFGAFVQATYSGVERRFAWDNMDLRAVTSGTSIGETDVLFGLSLNNSPSVQDAWNTLPVWGFPFTSSGLAPSPAAAPLISGGLGQNAVGLSAYTWIDSQYYAELGLYRSVAAGALTALGTSPTGTSLIKDAAPYFRVAWQKSDADQANFQIGAFGLFAKLYPDRDRTSGLTDNFNDLGLDASYQRFMGANTFTLNGRVLRESQRQDATVAAGGASNASNTLYDATVNASYYWQNKIGGTVGAFRTSGSSDALLYAANSTNKPDSSGFVFQIDGTPFGGGDGPLAPYLNLRLGLQYTAYMKFDGASKNYENSGRNASDNNTIRAFAWFAF